PATEPTPADLAAPLLTAKTLEPDPTTGEPRLATDPAACADLRARRSEERRVGEEAGARRAPLLSDTLAHAPLIHQTQRKLAERERLRLGDLARELWGEEGQQALRSPNRRLHSHGGGDPRRRCSPPRRWNPTPRPANRVWPPTRPPVRTYER